MSTITTWQHLERDPKSSLRQLSIRGRRIRALTLYGRYAGIEQMTPEEIAEDYDISVDAVREAIAYCESNPPEIQDDFRREEARMEATGMNDPNYKYNPRPKLLSPDDIARINRA